MSETDTRPTANLRRHLMSHHIPSQGGTLDAYYIQFGSQTYDTKFINRCLDELDKIPMRISVGDSPSNLEKLAYDLLAVGSFMKE